MEDFEKITDFGNLYKAYRKAKAGKGFKNSSAKFETLALDGVHCLKEQLENRTYQISGYHEFMVYEPKERVIKACKFKDKVVQHVLCDNILLPRLKREFIKNNSAGQIGKGTLYGLDMLKKDMCNFYKENGMNGWILKCDVSKFFYKIEHEKLKNIVDFYFPDEGIKWMNHLIIDSIDNPGLPLGNQTSQVYALLYLNGMDHFIIEDLGIKYYGRYMDDFYLIHSDKQYLSHCLVKIRGYLDNIKLELNGKTQIMPFKNGINFIGFHTYITKEGRVIRKIKNQNKRNAKRKFRKMAKLVRDGKLSEKKFFESYSAWKSHASHGNCKKLIQNMDQMVQKIMEENSVTN